MTDRNKGKAPSQRQLKVGELIRHALAEIFTRGEIVDDVLDRYSLTVPEVRMTPDLKLATVFVLPLGGEGADDVVKHLEQHKRFLRGELARRVSLKFMPELRFKADTSFAASQTHRRAVGLAQGRARPRQRLVSRASRWRGSAKVFPSTAGSSSTSRKA